MITLLILAITGGAIAFVGYSAGHDAGWHEGFTRCSKIHTDQWRESLERMKAAERWDRWYDQGSDFGPPPKADR